MELDPIVVHGAPRSGTTYVRSILNAHPGVCLTNEVRSFEWIRRALRLAEVEERSLYAHRDEFLTTLREELPELVRGFYRRMAPGARWWGDKNPHYAENADTLQTLVELFPGARFVHVYRDPRGVLASILSKLWVGLEEAHMLIVQHVNVASTFGAEVGSDRQLELSYEELVGDDLGVSRSMFEWLGIDFAKKVEAFCRRQARKRTPLCGPTRDLSEPASREVAIRDWQRMVPAEHQRESLEYLAPLLLSLGYEDERTLDDLYRTLPKRGRLHRLKARRLREP